MTREAYPLHWPEGWPRSRRQRQGRFGRKPFARARDEMLRELDLMGASNIILSTNVQLRQDGLPYSNRPQPQDTGVAVYFTYNGDDIAVCCDLWYRVDENLWAVRKTIESMRAVERWGVSEMLKRAFKGFKALPAGESWQSVLGFEPGQTYNLSMVKSRFRQLSLKAHPDHGGSVDQMQRLQNAYNQALKSLGE